MVLYFDKLIFLLRGLMIESTNNKRLFTSVKFVLLAVNVIGP